MAGFLSVRVAPGVRLSASGRGLRAHVGPRTARLHVGGGGTGVSTGAGPFTYYQSLQGSANRRAASSAASSNADQEKAALAQRIRLELQAISDLHRHAFESPSRQNAELPELPSFQALLEAAEAEHFRGIGLFKRRERMVARRRAREATEQHARILLARAGAEQAEQQALLDRDWADLLGNDEVAVLSALGHAFEDNQAPAAAVGVEGGTAFVAVLVPGPELLPDRLPSVTSAGNLSLKKMTKSQRASWHLSLVAGHVVATIREALAACPGLGDVTVVALRREPGVRPSPVLVTNLERHSLEQVSWEDHSAWDVVERLGRETRVRFKGVAREMATLDLSDEPELKKVLDAFQAGPGRPAEDRAR